MLPGALRPWKHHENTGYGLMDLFLIKKILAALVLPPTGPLILAFLGLALLKARPGLGRGLAWLAALTLLALCLPIVSDSLLRTVSHGGALDFAQARNAQAVVILAGGVRRNAVEFGGDTLGRLSLDRVRYGAVVARKTQLPVLVTGGVVFAGVPEAALMKVSLENEFHVHVRWAEVSSRNTRENAVKSAEILRASGVNHIILVGHSFDMTRATAEFTAAGLEVIPAPTHIPSGTFESLLDLMPSVSSLQYSYYALYELLANAVRILGV
jgi:uncharacterized SAM-binding protein YcdF (DUF218 family)